MPKIKIGNNSTAPSRVVQVKNDTALRSIASQIRSISLSNLHRLAVFSLLSVAPAYGTTVIAVTTNDSTYLGADSRTQPSGSICKIVARNGVAVGFSGLLRDSATGYDVARDINTALSGSRDLVQALNSLRTDIGPGLGRSLEWGRRNAPKEYRAFDGKLALSILVIGFSSNAPSISVISWTAQNGRVIRQDGRELGPNQFNGIGTLDALISYLSLNRQWFQAPPQQRIQSALEIENSAAPAEVGPPFSIVQIDRRGVRWLNRGPCEESH